MYVMCVNVKVKPEHVEDFIRVTRANYDGTRTSEPGNVRWDLLQAEDDPTHFFIYEVYRTKEDVPSHQATAHYQAWKAAVADWMAEPRVGVRYTNVYPADTDWNK